jgi:hypothetical protein
MRSKLLIIVAISLFTACNPYKPKTGDIIFQTSLSSQSKAIQAATHSPYSHMGIVFLKRGKPFVLEASSIVKFTPLSQWIDRGENGKYAVKRLKNADGILTDSAISKMEKIGGQFKGYRYDLYFEWSDERMYCSELVWKIYERATGLKIGELRKLNDFDLSSPDVKKKLQERFGDHIPEDEVMISPKSMFESELVEIVYKN